MLLAYFADQGMTDEKLQRIVGPGSMLKMIITQIRFNIYADDTFGWYCDPRDTSKSCKYTEYQVRENQDELVNYQWGSGAFLNNTNFYISGIDSIEDGVSEASFSATSSDVPMYWAAPEFGIWL